MFKNPVLQKLPNNQYQVLLGEYGNHPELYYSYDWESVNKAMPAIMAAPAGTIRGELNHPKTFDISRVSTIQEDRVCFRIDRLDFTTVVKKRGTYIRVMAIITPTGPLANEFIKLLEGNRVWRFGFRVFAAGSGQDALRFRIVDRIVTWDVVQAAEMAETFQFRQYPQTPLPEHLRRVGVEERSVQLLMEVIRSELGVEEAQVIEDGRGYGEMVKIQLPSFAWKGLYCQMLTDLVVKSPGFSILIQPGNSDKASYMLLVPRNRTEIVSFTMKLLGELHHHHQLKFANMSSGGEEEFMEQGDAP